MGSRTIAKRCWSQFTGHCRVHSWGEIYVPHTQCMGKRDSSQVLWHVILISQLPQRHFSTWIHCFCWGSGRNVTKNIFSSYIGDATLENTLFIFLFLLKYSWFIILCFRCTAKWFSWFFQITFNFRLLQDIEYSSLYYRVNPCCLSILCIVVCVY